MKNTKVQFILFGFLVAEVYTNLVAGENEKIGQSGFQSTFPAGDNSFYHDDTDENLAVGSIRIVRQTEGQRCHIRSCEQTITGRRLNYRRALEIVQNEEYLSEADRSVIRYKREAQDKDLKLLASNNFTDSILEPVHAIGKRSADYCFNQVYSSSSNSSSNSTVCVPVASGALATGLLALLFAGAKLQGLLPRAPPPVQTPRTVVVPPPGQAPADSIQPGQPGGGDPPQTNNFASFLAPPGTVPVAVFPPFLRPRTYPSVCVIFSEPSPYDNYVPNSGYGRYRRSIFPWNIRRGYQNYQSYQQRSPSWERSDSYSNSYSNSNNIRQVDREYGFRCVITLVNEICQLGLTCDSLGNKIVVQTNRADHLLSRQTGEEFSSDSAPLCRTTLSPSGCV